jgi:membrane protein required for colicin V production
MNVIDIVLIIILIAAAIHGFIKGFFVEFASVAALVLGIWGAIEFSGIVREWLSDSLNWRPETIRLVAFILIFVVVVVIVHLIANLVEQFVKAIALGIFSRLAGAIFGVLKAAFLLSILMLIVAKIEESHTTIIPENAKKESRYYKPIERFAPNILPFLKSDPNDQPGKNKKEFIV